MPRVPATSSAEAAVHAVSAESPPTAAPWAHRRLTPMLEQYVAAKAQVPEALLLFRMGDFYELFFDDARVAAEQLDLTLTARDKGEDPIPMAGVPHHAIDGYIAKLIERGFSVALCDQIEDPRTAKGIVKREIVRLITPGTVCDLEALEPGRHSYLAAAVPLSLEPSSAMALALLDVLSGEFLCCVLPTCNALVDEMQRMGAREALLPQALQGSLALRLRQANIKVITTAASEASRPLAAVKHLSLAQQKALCAAAASVVTYAEKTQRQSLSHLEPIRFYERSQSLMLDEASRRSLELVASSDGQRRQGTLLELLDQTATALGSRLLRRWLLAPLRHQERIIERSDAVAQLKDERAKRDALKSALKQVRDIERLAGRLALDRANPRDLLSLGRSLVALKRVAQHAVELQPQSGILSHWRKLDVLEGVGQTLIEALADEPPVQTQEGGIFARGFSAKLDELMELCDDAQGKLSELEAEERRRSGIGSLKIRYNRVFGYYIEVSRAQLQQVPPHYTRRQTLANAERFTTVALSEFEHKILGARHERHKKESELFAALIEATKQHVVQVKRLARAVATTDALVALGQVADEHRYVRPVWVDAPDLELKGARHPVLETLCPRGERFVPNDLLLNHDNAQLMVMTGPNMAGKSTLMRQAALAVIMAQMGGFVAADTARLGLCDQIFTRVGAQDHLGRGQSTFMVEMAETAAILKHASPKSLVLLDEVGRGTSTFDGLSIAWAVVEYLHDAVCCRTLFATHYHELTALAAEHDRMFNARMAVREQADGIAFLRQLEPGGADRSYGLEVARLAELPKTVLERAKVILESLEKQRQPTASPRSSRQARQVAQDRRAKSQLDLFEPGHRPTGRDPAAAAVMACLEGVVPETTTPMEALVLLERLVQLGRSERPSEHGATATTHSSASLTH